VSWKAQLANQKDIKRHLKGIGHLRRNRNPTTRQAEHYRFFKFPFLKLSC
jgi:hypothetical protein